MHGPKATIPDIVLEDLVLPSNLLSNEDLSLEAELEDQTSPYSIVTYCDGCPKRLRISVVATREAIQDLERLLFGSLRFVCATCSRSLRDGR